MQVEWSLLTGGEMMQIAGMLDAIEVLLIQRGWRVNEFKEKTLRKLIAIVKRPQ